MSKEWPYAKLSKLAKQHGGPDQLIRDIFQMGATAERKRITSAMMQSRQARKPSFFGRLIKK